MPHSSVPLSVLSNNFLPSDPLEAWDMTLDELLDSLGVENASNTALRDQPMTDSANIVQRDVMIEEQYSTSLPVKSEEN
ncbi:hypothetical protein TIFTF001_013226 [Ficus carica]|uniref:Uncharacterized protein n=1 Tax=Ficus carica TaxID=3494 RepID=A0AA88A0I6_FICCA|nr:hypothetical protein TIFTF001_013226 [Ficus carica]